jgi:hypothetical protein
MAARLTELDRERWIAEAAYYRAEKRGFEPGFALEDWIVAEAWFGFELDHNTVDAMVGPKSARRAGARGRDES